jgi:hypothetical protein
MRCRSSTKTKTVNSLTTNTGLKAGDRARGALAVADLGKVRRAVAARANAVRTDLRPILVVNRRGVARRQTALVAVLPVVVRAENNHRP